MKTDKLFIGQPILIVKKPNKATMVEVGDVATECGFSDNYQFHSSLLVPRPKDIGENYWVEFLERDEYLLLTKHEYETMQGYSKWDKDSAIKFLVWRLTLDKSPFVLGAQGINY